MAAASELDDDESVLEPSEQTNRPPDVAFAQQRIPAWHPILDPLWVIIALFYLGAILVPVGFKLDSLQDEIIELQEKYDDFYAIEPHECAIGDKFNANHPCQIRFEVTEDMSPPILVHYELTNFHQNHRSYYQSRDDYQLLGRVGEQDPVSKQRCKPLNELGNITLNPCGVTANTFFNDVFKLVEGKDAMGIDLFMSEEGIAWQSDLEYAFAQPEGFRAALCPNNGTLCDETCCTGVDEDGDFAGLEWSCKKPHFEESEGVCYRYYYPEDEKTQYLYETYENIISPLEGVTNEHFVVWMRIATNPTFRKLYGWINEPIPKGQTLVFNVTANYVVSRFRGSKSLILSTNNIFGGRNPYLGASFYGVGFFCLAAGTFFALKQTLRPRKLADPNHLHFKQD
uniref:ALA-interacting subunit n=1 Tax=Amphora coffeiformis TaxID=265554 RepID=A0A7S3PBZ4_9STRA|mmetsp:Transcript_9181/g.17509  ORF Transcript_9181/g.17509 Transcript_9181/m.17509 type:complete len:398 (+) Transcript_9181:108-1301(+)